MKQGKHLAPYLDVKCLKPCKACYYVKYICFQHAIKSEGKTIPLSCHVNNSLQEIFSIVLAQVNN